MCTYAWEMEKEGERWRRKMRGRVQKGQRERNVKSRQQLKSSRVPKTSVLIVLLPGLAIWKLDMIFNHSLLEVNFSFGKETAGLELAKSWMFYNAMCWEGMGRNLNIKNAQTTLPLPAKTDMLLVLWRENIQIYLLLLMSPEIFAANLGIRSSAY